MGLRVDILGPLRLSVDEAFVDVRRNQAARALCLLALRGTAGCSRDELIDVIWNDELPKDPAASLRVAMSRLRSYLDPYQDRLTSTGHGFHLDTDSDIEEFRRIQSPPELTNDDLTGCLDLWRGRPLAELADVAEMHSEVAELEALRLNAICVLSTRLNDAKAFETSLRYTSSVAGEADSEVLLALHAVALGALGRRAEALELIEGHRSHLRDQFGTSPGPEIADVEARLLRDESSLPTQSQKHTNTGIPVDDFVGRTSELQELGRAGPGVNLIVGEPGAGKSALLDVFLAGATERGAAPALFVRASQTPAVPMEPLTELLRAVARATSRSDWSSELRGGLSRLASDELDVVVTPPSSRASLLSVTATAISEHLRVSGCCLIVDDAQWLDRASTQVLTELAENGSSTIVLAARTTMPRHVQTLVSTAANPPITVGSLDVADIEQLLTRRFLSGPPIGARDTVARLSGGNALFAGLLVELLAEGAIREQLPPTLLLAVQRRLDGLSPGTTQCVRTASIFPGPFTDDVLSQIVPDSASHLSEALRHGIFTQRADGMLEFAHALVADAAYQMLPEGVRIELHDEIGRILEAEGANPAEYALHCGEAASLDPIRAIEAHLAAGQDFASSFDWDNAQLHAQRGLFHHREQQLEKLDGQLHLLRGQAKRAQGDPSGDENLMAALAAAQEFGDQDLIVEAVIGLCSQGRIGTEEGDVILPALRSALLFDLRPSQRARLLAAGSTLVSISPLQQEGRDMFRSAAEIVSGLGERDRKAQIDVWNRTHVGCPLPADSALRETAVHELRRLSGDDPDLRWEAAFLEFGLATTRSDTTTAAACLDELRELGPQLRMRLRDFGTSFVEAAWARYLGELDRSEHLLDEMLATGNQSFSEEWVLNIYTALITSIREEQGRLGDLLPFVEELIEQNPEWPTWHCIAGAAAAQIGDIERATAELAWLRADDFACLSPDLSWPAMLSLLSEIVAVTQDREAAAALLRLVTPLAGTVLWNGVCVHKSADQVIAIATTVSTAIDT